MPDDIANLAHRQDTLEKQFGDFIKRWDEQQNVLFKKMDEQARLNDEKRDTMSRDLGSKIDALKEGEKPNLMVIWTALGVAAVIFGTLVGGMMWGIDREFAHVRDDRTCGESALQMQVTEIQRWHDDSVARDLNELQQRRMKDNKP